MCDASKLFSGGNIGGILGGLAGTGLSIFAPELGIPLALATGLGSAGGTFLGDVASGKSAGASILPSLESGAISGGLAGVGNVAAGGDFFGAPASSITNFVGSTPTDAASTAGTAAAPIIGSDPAAAAIGSTVASAATPGVAAVSPAATLASTAPGTSLGTVGAAAGAPAAGAGAAGGDVSAALSSATGGAGSAGANLGGSAIGTGGVPLAGPTGALGPSGAAGPTFSGTGGAGGSPAAGGSGGNIFSNIWGKLSGGGGTNPAAIADLTQGGAPLAPNISAPNLAALSALNPGDPGLAAATATGSAGTGGGSVLSRGLFGEPGSVISDLTKPTTLLTGGAALAPLLMGNTIPGLSDLQNQAKTFNAMGTPLAQSLTTGQLPAGAQTSLDAATRAAQAAVRSQYANMGLSGSSQEADQLAGVAAKEATQKVAMLEDLTGIGLKEMGMATPLLTQIMQSRLAQDQQMQQAIAKLAATLAGSTGTEKTTA
jgi:hypothetical protein